MVKLAYCNASPLSNELVRFRNSKAHMEGRKEPHTHNTRATMIWGTEYEAACITPPIVTKSFPIIIQLRLPNGIPITMTRHDTKAAASVLEDAIIGIVSAPPGCYNMSVHAQF